MKIDTYLDKFNKKLDKAEANSKKKLENLEKINEIELLVKFDSYKPLKFERLKKHGKIIWDHALDAYEMTPDEFEYYLARYLYETSPEDRYNEGKAHWYNHKYTSFDKIEIGDSDLTIKQDTILASEVYGCTGSKCVPECEYYSKTGRIEDEEVINDWLERTTIVDLDQYKEELGEELFNKIMRDDDSYDRDRMRQECIDYYAQTN